MSQTDNTDDMIQRTVDKQVQVIAYLSDQSYGDWRKYVNDHDDDVDYQEMESKTSTSLYLTGMGERIEISEEQYEKFSQNNIGRLSLKKDVDEYSSFSNQPRSYLRDVAGIAVESLHSDLDDFEMGNYWRTRMHHSDMDCKVRVKYSTRVLGMLKHPSEATPDDPFENNEDLMAMEFTIKIKGATEDLLEMLDDEFVSEFIKTISKSEEIDKVRVYDCEIDTSEKGVCFNI